MLQVNPKLHKIEISVIRKIAEASAKYKGIDSEKKLINLTIGEPDLEQPQTILEKTKDYMSKEKIGYSQLGGFLSLREEIAKKYKEQYGVDCSADEIIITVGTTEGIATTIRTIIQDGDEVIIPLPAYPGYEPLITLAGGTLVKVDTSKDGYELTVENLKKFVTKKTRAILVNYPSNPSGVILSKKNRDEILEFAYENELYIISDEVYSDLVFDGEFHSFLTNEHRENVILLNGFSKSHSLTGWRVGYIIADKKLRSYLIKVHQYSVTSASSISQNGALAAMRECSDLNERRDIYKNRAQAVCKKFEENGFIPIKPQGGIYVFLPLSNMGVKDTYDFAMRLLEEERVAIIPGTAFDMEGYIRISLIENTDTLLEATERIIRFVKNNY